ncbi:MAG: CofH family radical SAM protein [Phycisphaerae bacterium]|nr:CofH family radical SAM protein [Phycisphaerae bacterium]
MREHKPLSDIAEKVEAGLRLSAEEGLRLFDSEDLHEIGRLADVVRRRKNGRATWYVVNRHINYTNYCVLRCRFCSFCRPYGQGAVDGYELSVEEVIERAVAATGGGATELHIVGGLHPRLPLSYYTEMVSGIRRACPDVHIKAFTAIEIVHLSRMARPRLTVTKVLERLVEAGLDSLPGGGAEIFDQRVHAETFKRKVGEVGWFQVHRTAHEMGVPSTATMLFGHVETRAERVGHLLKLRAHQDASLSARRAHFQALVPLPFIPGGSGLSHLPGPSGLESLKTLAIARLLLDNVGHIKAFWPMLSPKLAQVSLSFGVDDLDGTVGQYDVTHRDGAPAERQALTVERLRRLIRETGRIPLQRDSLYRVLSTG